MDQTAGRLSISNHVSIVSCFLACAGDFAVTFTLGASYSGYDFIQQSESYLGTSESPVATYVNVWWVIFCVLLMIFAYGLRETIFRRGIWQAIAVACVCLYGLGEGAGSGLFPYNHVQGVLTVSGKLHDFFGALAGLAITFLPYAGTKIFTVDTSPRMHAYSWVVLFSGLLLIGVFLVSERGIIPYKGALQRLFILDYHLYLSMLAVVMMRSKGASVKSPSPV